MAPRSSFLWNFILLALLIITPAPRVIAVGVYAQSTAGSYLYQSLHGLSDQTIVEPPASATVSRPANVLTDLRDALTVMQHEYFSLWLGTWTDAIDWTAAVMSTYVSATLLSLSQSIDYTLPGTSHKESLPGTDALLLESEINKYFAQSVSYYFGEDHFAIRMQAYDDMLWVVLGWLESMQLIESHSKGHYTENPVGSMGWSDGWHASQFTPAFAHRARIFYELAERGWDWRLCSGGMTWNPRLLPYKNAITNQLFIAASVSMYLHFRGDENCSPFLPHYDVSRPRAEGLSSRCGKPIRQRYDPIYLANAVNGYDWLKSSGMVNDQGLYVDGFHIQGYRSNHSKSTCDERNEMVYTYNQGVILSGLQGLWEATGNITYLEDGHDLVRNVIRATGWYGENSPVKQPHQESDNRDNTRMRAALPLHWSGLGSSGILTELCDLSGHCSQDSQAFKGIFFHHLTAFCIPLSPHAVRPGNTFGASREIVALHQQSCNSYSSWVTHNAQAALRTRDDQGRFGAWWGAPEGGFFEAAGGEYHERPVDTLERVLPSGACDYRNNPLKDYISDNQPRCPDPDAFTNVRNPKLRTTADWNDRGRGRSIEAHGSGLAVVRAMWEFIARKDRHSAVVT